MADNFIPGLQQARNCLIHRIRELPIKGQTLVSKGDQVKPEQIVAKAELPGDVQIIRIAELLGIEPQDVAAGLKVSIGESVKKGQVLCEHRGLFGLFRSIYSAPCDGNIDFISASLGHVGLRMPSEILSINAYCGGEVKEIVEGLSVEISTYATVVQGIFGIGGERLGVIKILDINPNQLLRVEALPQDLRGAIIVGGTCPDMAVLSRLSEGGAVGLVVGGIDDVALQEFLGFDIGLAITGNEEISFSVMVSEGFGALAISERVLSLLTPHQGSFACINGTTQIRAGAIRPEIIVPTPVNSAVAEPPKSQGLELGSRVRLIRVPYFGVLGEVVEMPSKPERLKSGTLARILKVRVEGGEVVSVPRANAEILIS